MKKIGGSKPVNETLILNYKDTVSAKGSTGNDIYVITSSQTKNVNIIDSVGKNTIILEDNLGISAIKALKSSLKLTLENKAVITISNPSKFTFKLGGTVQNNKLTNFSSESLNFTDFVNEIISLSQPTATKNLNNLGTVIQNESIDAGSTKMTLTASPMTSKTYAEIINFGKNDHLIFSEMTASDFEQMAMVSSDENGDVNIVFNTKDNGELYKVTLLGVATPEDNIFDLASFNQLAVGDITFA